MPQSFLPQSTPVTYLTSHASVPLSLTPTYYLETAHYPSSPLNHILCLCTLSSTPYTTVLSQSTTLIPHTSQATVLLSLTPTSPLDTAFSPPLPSLTPHACVYSLFYSPCHSSFSLNPLPLSPTILMILFSSLYSHLSPSPLLFTSPFPSLIPHPAVSLF